MIYIEDRLKNSDEEEIIDYLLEKNYSKDIILSTVEDESLGLDPDLIKFYFEMHKNCSLYSKKKSLDLTYSEIYRKAVDLNRVFIENNHFIFPITMCICRLIGM